MKKVFCFVIAVTMVLIIIGTFIESDVKVNAATQMVSVKIKSIDKKSIKFKIKNKTDKYIFSGPMAQLYIYKKKKWNNIVFFMPKTIPLEKNETLIYKRKWSELIRRSTDKKYLSKKKNLKRGKYKLKIYNKTFHFKIK